MVFRPMSCDNFIKLNVFDNELDTFGAQWHYMKSERERRSE